MDRFGRARIDASIKEVDSVSYIYKLGVQDGLIQTVVDIGAVTVCAESNDMFFVFSDLYTTALKFNGTTRYKQFHVQVWVQPHPEQGQVFFYLSNNIPVAIGEVDDDGSIEITQVFDFESRYFHDKSVFIKPAAIICQHYDGGNKHGKYFLL
ncbi:hypothetical protein GEMRC1_002391 [Eukaryota sp. GEM-RC1]